MTRTAPIRLFVDAHVFDGEYQGSRTFIKELYSQLALNDQLHLFIAAFNVDSLRTNFPDSTNITYIKYSSKSRIWRLLIQIPAILKKHQIDYAHFQYIIPIFKPCRFIVTTHDVLFNDCPQYFSKWYRLQKNWLYRYAVKRADILTTVSDFSKQSINRYFEIGLNKIHVIPHGVAGSFFEPYNKSEAAAYTSNTYGTGTVILYVSRFEPRKNHALLLKAFIELELYNKGYSLVLAGHPSIPVPEFDRLLHSLPEAAKKKVLIFTSLTDAELLRFYKAAAVFVYPSAAEGFGMPPLEAAALGIPVLCNNRTALSDFTFFKANHFDFINDSVLKNRLTAALSSAGDHSELAEIRTFIQQNYSWAKAATAFIKLIEQNSLHDRL
jgi:glycosyltransferase involved in cell wall biosynthesis